MELAFTAGRATRRRVAVPSAGPFWHLAGMFPEAADIFLLDSALNEGGLGRWSYAGGEPSASLAGRRRTSSGDGLDLELTVWREPDGTPACPPRRLCLAGDPVAALRAVRDAYADAPDDDATAGKAPFAGGLVGWFGYGAAWASENLPPGDGQTDSMAPDLLFMVVDDVLCHDHVTGATTLLVTGRGADGRAADADLASRLAVWQARLAAAPARRPGEPLPAAQPATDCATAPDLTGITAACDESAYCAAVSRCREHILCGDAFEICLTQQLSAPLRAAPWDLYAALRAVNPAPFAAFLRAGGVTVVGASPERFLSATAGGVLESRPIKGTRPRGASPIDDARLRRELAEAEKDRAENLMIVDLVRSDLGRVARIGSVTVPELCVVETYATVHQMVSTIRADLKPGCDALDAVRACFPGGSMTGAPKLEAMTIIAGLEPAERGIYAGALGWLGWDGAMDLSIVIRTFVCAGGRATFGVGGAVTADSDPAAEYRESLDKARALLAALRLSAGSRMDNAPTTEGTQP